MWLFNFALLNPTGSIAFQERNIMFLIIGLMLIAVIPAYIFLIRFARKYRANHSTIHNPEDNKNTKLVWLFWLLPTFVVALIALVTWQTTHALDPYKAVASENTPITIDVVALQWKWLFIYPDQHIATVNFVEIPVNTPVHFVLTADAAMNSFWIPQLGSQMGVMPGMVTQLNLIANTTGDFNGLENEINGEGYAGMTFITRSVSSLDFLEWAASTTQASHPLTQDAYNTLAEPSTSTPPTFYSSIDENLYNDIIKKYMAPGSMNDMPDMNMSNQ